MTRPSPDAKAAEVKTAEGCTGEQTGDNPEINAKVNLLDLDRDAITDLLQKRGAKRYRAEQLFRRLHKDNGDPFADLPPDLRAHLRRATTTIEPRQKAVLPAKDGTRKLLFDIGGGVVDAVLIPQGRRLTLCISSQAGCALACKFCLTGRQGFSRNLTSGQIIGQLRAANRLAYPAKVSNVVMMGMGEPLLNLPALLPALRVMTDDWAFGLPPRRVTVSTAGIVPAMAHLKAGAKCALAVSLHAPDDSLRDELMPINRRYPLAMLMAACREHIGGSKREFVTMEYVMLKGVNDSDSCARDLTRLLRGLRCKVNLIPFNTFANAGYQCSPMATIIRFRDILMRAGFVATIRQTRGDDILAACGQLAGQVRNNASKSIGKTDIINIQTDARQ